MKNIFISIAIFVSALIGVAQGRTWTDIKGRPLTAEFVKLDENDPTQVHLLTPKGKDVKVPINVLCQEDQDYIKKIANQKSNSVVYKAVQGLDFASQEAYNALLQVRDSDTTRIEPDFTIALRFIFHKKDYLHAQQHFNRCLKINPNDIGTLLNLGTLNIILGKYPEAYSYYQKVHDLGGSNKTLSQNLHKLLAFSNARKVIIPETIQRKFMALANEVYKKTNSYNPKQGWMFERCSEGISQELQKCHWFQHKGYRPYEYQICPNCNGTKFVDCPKCTGGKVSIMTKKTVRFPNGDVASVPSTQKVPCRECRGKGHLSCRVCNGTGNEFQLSRMEVEEYERQMRRELEAIEARKEQERRAAEAKKEQERLAAEAAKRQAEQDKVAQNNPIKPDTPEERHGGFAVEVQDPDAMKKEAELRRKLYGVSEGNQQQQNDVKPQKQQHQGEQDIIDYLTQSERDEEERQAQLERKEKERQLQQQAEVARKQKELMKQQAIKSRSIDIGDIGISVVNVKIANAPLVSEFSGITSVSANRYLIVDVLIDNRSATNKIEFQSWAGDRFGHGSLAELKDEFENDYKQVGFGTGTIISGNKALQSIYPESKATDRLVFQLPIKNAKVLTLILPGKNFGDDSGKKAKIPIKTSDIEEETNE